MKWTFCLLQPRIDPRTSSLTAQFIIHCSNLSICLQLLICLYLSSFMFLNIRFVPRQLCCLFVIIVRALSVFSVAFSCFSVFFKLICRLSFYTFIEHVCAPKHTFFTVSSVYALLNGFLVSIVNRLIIKQVEMLML